MQGLVKERVNVSTWILLAVFLGLTLAMELGFMSPVRLPGHRAFPGALALLLFAEAFVPWLLLGFAVVMPLVLAALGVAPWLAIAAWLVPAILIALSQNAAFRRSILWFLGIGLLFGLARYLSLGGFHKTPELFRVGGHLSFGVLAGLSAYGLSRLNQRQIEER